MSDNEAGMKTKMRRKAKITVNLPPGRSNRCANNVSPECVDVDFCYRQDSVVVVVKSSQLWIK